MFSARKPKAKAPQKRRRGEPLPSMCLGVPSVVIGLFDIVALTGYFSPRLPDFIRRGAIFVSRPDPESRYRVTKTAWWYVPESGFWIWNALGLVLAAAGILLYYRKGRPITSWIAMGLNTLAAVAGYIFTVIDDGERV